MVALRSDELKSILREVHESRGWFYKEGHAYEAAAELGYLALIDPGSGPMDEYYCLTQKGRDYLGLPPQESVASIFRSWITGLRDRLAQPR